MAKEGAGILVFRENSGKVEVMLVHPDGPFWAKKDLWSIPKGELKDGEEYLDAARREFEEELGFQPPPGEFIELGSSSQNMSKTNHIWAVEGDPDLTKFKCNSMVKLEWPPKSGEQIEFPEIDKAEWFSLEAAAKKLFKGQVIFVERLAEKLGAQMPGQPEQSRLL